MSARRHSRTPLGLMQDEALLMVQAADADPTIREACEVFTGREWSTLTKAEQVDALIKRDNIARGAGAVSGAMRSLRDLKQETYLAKYGVSAEDRNDLLVTEVADLKAKVERLEEENQRLRATNSALTAADAMAVHSDGA